MLSSEQLTRLASALGGLPILGCRPGSPAARVGIRYGDVLLAVNGIATPDWGAFVEARGARIGVMEVDIFRAGVELRLEVAFDPDGDGGYIRYFGELDALDAPLPS
jgi:S1-C subfamily serine protease